jgi:exodeoxyribonuclease III
MAFEVASRYILGVAFGVARPLAFQSFGRARSIVMVGTRKSKGKRPNAAAPATANAAPEKRARVQEAQPAPPPDTLAVPAEFSVPSTMTESGTLSIISFNVCSLRTMLKSNLLQELVAVAPADFILLQETKMTDESQAKLVDADILPGYSCTWNHCVSPKGHHGVATLMSDTCPFRVSSVDTGIGSSVDAEGRVLSLHLVSDVYKPITLVNLYVPNSGAKLLRLDMRIDDWESRFREYVAQAMLRNPVVVCGDLNVAHEEIDIFDSKGNKGNAGHTPQERAAFGQLLSAGEGLVDSFRALNPDVKDAYTFWSRRSPTTRAKVCTVTELGLVCEAALLVARS